MAFEIPKTVYSGRVREITLGISSGIGDSDRVKQLYQRMGGVRVGDNFVVPQE